MEGLLVLGNFDHGIEHRCQPGSGGETHLSPTVSVVERVQNGPTCEPPSQSPGTSFLDSDLETSRDLFSILLSLPEGQGRLLSEQIPTREWSPRREARSMVVSMVIADVTSALFRILTPGVSCWR